MPCRSSEHYFPVQMQGESEPWERWQKYCNTAEIAFLQHHPEGDLGI